MQQGDVPFGHWLLGHYHNVPRRERRQHRPTSDPNDHEQVQGPDAERNKHPIHPEDQEVGSDERKHQWACSASTYSDSLT